MFGFIPRLDRDLIKRDTFEKSMEIPSELSWTSPCLCPVSHLEFETFALQDPQFDTTIKQDVLRIIPSSSETAAVRKLVGRLFSSLRSKSTVQDTVTTFVALELLKVLLATVDKLIE